MIAHFFKPKKIETSRNLILLPFFPQQEYLKKIMERSIRKKSILGSVMYSYADYDVLYGFLGYSNLLTILEFVSMIREKNIYFLGTAGSLNPDLNKPEVLNVEKVFPGSIFKYFTDKDFLNLKKSDITGMKNVNGISIDLIQRENHEWFESVRQKKLDIVEMEIFPLCWYLEKEITAHIVVSDIVSEAGIINLNRKQIAEEFVRGFESILESMK